MPEEIEVETGELQEAIDELHEEREERLAEAKRNEWTRYIGLSTAIFAVFAAIGAMQSGALVNEAMIQQIKASDKWNEYQAARTKVHLYTLQVDELVEKSAASPRLARYAAKIEEENAKAKELKPKAEELEKESEHLMHRHHRFVTSVTAIQVSIALGAVAALTRTKPIWLLGAAVGLVGVVTFVIGLAG